MTRAYLHRYVGVAVAVRINHPQGEYINMGRSSTLTPLYFCLDGVV